MLSASPSILRTPCPAPIQVELRCSSNQAGGTTPSSPLLCFSSSHLPCFK
uniref:Uncharacterized protein n=1 Tax=Arundo donax TaxID=35708 RepID=A0A0A8XXE2_ARUDO